MDITTTHSGTIRLQNITWYNDEHMYVIENRGDHWILIREDDLNAPMPICKWNVAGLLSAIHDAITEV